MNEWARKDAMRALRRCRHVIETGGELTDAQLAYLRGQAMALLLGPLSAELTAGHAECLRAMLRTLELAAALRAGEVAS